MRKTVLEALAVELAEHLDDLVETGEELTTEDGTQYPVLGTSGVTAGNGMAQFLVNLDGRDFLVTAQEIPEGNAICGHREFAKRKCGEMACYNYYTIGS